MTHWYLDQYQNNKVGIRMVHIYSVADIVRPRKVENKVYKYIVSAYQLQSEDFPNGSLYCLH